MLLIRTRLEPQTKTMTFRRNKMSLNLPTKNTLWNFGKKRTESKKGTVKGLKDDPIFITAKLKAMLPAENKRLNFIVLWSTI